MEQFIPQSGLNYQNSGVSFCFLLGDVVSKDPPCKPITSCPAEDDLKHMFKVSCWFEQDRTAKSPELCDSFTEFQRRKNTALWESVDGDFMGYVACAVSTAEAKGAQLTSVAVSQNRGLYKVSCSYENGIRLAMRTPRKCKMPNVNSTSAFARANCSSDMSACKVVCDGNSPEK